MNAKTLHCYSCGAAVSSDDPNCAHCGARLASVSCPACFGMMFQGSKFCPHCGGPATQWDGEDSKRLCPGCQTPMLRGNLNGIPLHECGRCYGLWLDAPTFERICRDSEQQALVISSARSLGAPVTIGPVRYVRCPQCTELMHRVNFARCSGVVVDVCRSHGTWFDMNELHRIVEFIRAGGMDRSREKQKADLVEEQRRLKAARVASAWDGGQPPVKSSGYDIVDVVGSAAEIISMFIR
jgi:Zn-finger nucleic acid-binding protein